MNFYEFESIPAKNEQNRDILKKCFSYNGFESYINSENDKKKKFLIDLTERKLKMFSLKSSSSLNTLRNKVLLECSLKKHLTNENSFLLSNQNVERMSVSENINSSTNFNDKVRSSPLKRRFQFHQNRTSLYRDVKSPSKKLKVSLFQEEEEMLTDNQEDLLFTDLASFFHRLKTQQ